MRQLLPDSLSLISAISVSIVFTESWDGHQDRTAANCEINLPSSWLVLLDPAMFPNSSKQVIIKVGWLLHNYQRSVVMPNIWLDNQCKCLVITSANNNKQNKQQLRSQLRQLRQTSVRIGGDVVTLYSPDDQLRSLITGVCLWRPRPYPGPDGWSILAGTGHHWPDWTTDFHCASSRSSTHTRTKLDQAGLRGTKAGDGWCPY